MFNNFLVYIMLFAINFDIDFFIFKLKCKIKIISFNISILNKLWKLFFFKNFSKVFFWITFFRRMIKKIRHAIWMFFKKLFHAF